MLKYALPIVLAAFAVPSLAAGDAANGEKEFNKCRSCHTITKADGTVVVKGGKVGPDLGGVVGRKIGSVEGFAYSDAVKKVAETGAVWDEAEIAAYVQDPSKWLDDNGGDPSLKSKMTFKLPKGGEDIAAFLASAVQ